MKIFMELAVLSILTLTCWTTLGQGHVDSAYAQTPRSAIEHFNKALKQTEIGHQSQM